MSDHPPEPSSTAGGSRPVLDLTAVREHFQTMFRKLFGGGKADVYLETEVEEEGKGSGFGVQGSGGEGSGGSSLNPEPGTLNPSRKKVDPLEAGIEIMAHPPGSWRITVTVCPRASLSVG